MTEHPDYVGTTIRTALLGVAAAVQLVLGLTPAIEYGNPLAWAAFVALAVVTVLCGAWVLRGRPLPPAIVLAGTVVVLAASCVATSTVPSGGHFQAPHWSFGLVGWHLVLLLFDRIIALFAAFAVHVAANVAQFLLAGVPGRAEIGTAGVVVLSTIGFQLAVLVIARMLHRSTHRAMEIAAERDRAATRMAVAEQRGQDQRTYFAGQLGLTLPLLADLADGVADPMDEDTRRRSALAATQLRRLFAENDAVADPLVHEISACADVAERRGVVVSLAVSGTPVPLPADVRRGLTGPVVAALSAARARARVSVLRTGAEVRVAVIADAGDVAPASSPGVEVNHGTYGGQVRMEATWRQTSS